MGFLVPAIILSVVLAIVLSTSYHSYVDMRTKYDATLEQYKGAVTMYADHATIDIERAAFTDFKYQGYQEHIAGFVKALRNKIVLYNRTFISKRILDRNIMFNWLIIAPDDDMVPISMLEKSDIPDCEDLPKHGHMSGPMLWSDPEKPTILRMD
jgi:hypothetical protein